MNCYKTNEVITGRAYRFHYFIYIYIYITLLASARLRALCVADHLWKLILCSFFGLFSILLIHWNQQWVTVQVHKLLQRFRSDDLEGTLFSWFHICITLILLRQNFSTWYMVVHLWILFYASCLAFWELLWFIGAKNA